MTNMITDRAIFWDRDGVLNYIADEGSPRTFAKFRIVKEMKPIMQMFRERGFLNFVVTNQPDIARKKMTEEDLQRMTDELWVQFPIDGVFICPHDDKDECECRKPKIGLLTQAAEEYRLNLADCLFIGDGKRDAQAAKNAGIPFLHVLAV